jgi:hypothetical protein
LRPSHVFAHPSIDDHTQLLALLRFPLHLVMVLRSLEGSPASAIAERFGSDPSTVRRWIQRFNREGVAGSATDPARGGRGWAAPSSKGASDAGWLRPRRSVRTLRGPHETCLVGSPSVAGSRGWPAGSRLVAKGDPNEPVVLERMRQAIAGLP